MKEHQKHFPDKHQFHDNFPIPLFRLSANFETN